MIAIDKAGREHRQEDGSFHLVEWTERGRARVVEVPVSKGAWRATLLHGRRVRVAEMRLGGRPAFVEDEDLVASGDVITLRARWQTPSILHVVDDAAGRPLSEVEVVRLTGWFHGDEFHPGGAKTTPVAVGARSPVTLPPRNRLAVYWVRARGFAWGRIHVDHGGGGERLIRLRRGGALEVKLADPVQNRRLYLCLRPEGSSADAAPLLESEIPRSGVTRLAGIQEGRYEVHVSSAEWYQLPTLLGSAKAEIAADSVYTLTIHLTSPDEAPAAVPLSGVLVIPSAWGDIDPSLEIVTARGTSAALIEELLSGASSRRSEHISIGRGKMAQDEAGQLRWSAGKTPPGEYVATVSSISYQVVLRVGPTGNTTARIEVPEPAEVVLRTVDETSGALVPVKELLWSPKWASFLDMGSPQRAGYSPKPGTFRLRAPVGAILLSVPDEGWALASPGPYEVRQGRNEHAVRLARMSGIRVSFRDGDSTVPYEFGAGMVSITSMEGHEDLETHWGDGSVLFLVRHPGEYELTFGHLPGFEQVAPKRVTLRRGETETLVTRLQRKAR